VLDSEVLNLVAAAANHAARLALMHKQTKLGGTLRIVVELLILFQQGNNVQYGIDACVCVAADKQQSINKNEARSGPLQSGT